MCDELETENQDHEGDKILYRRNLKKRGPDHVVRGVSTCTGINFPPIAKPFEMGGYLSVIKRPIFFI